MPHTATVPPMLPQTKIGTRIEDFFRLYGVNVASSCDADVAVNGAPGSITNVPGEVIVGLAGIVGGP